MAPPLSPSPGRCHRCSSGRRRSLPAGRRRRREAHGRAAPGWGECECGQAGSPSPVPPASGVPVPVSLQRADRSAQPPVSQCLPRGRGMRLTGRRGRRSSPAPPLPQVIRNPLPPHTKPAAQRPLLAAPQRGADSRRGGLASGGCCRTQRPEARWPRPTDLSLLGTWVRLGSCRSYRLGRRRGCRGASVCAVTHDVLH